MKKIVFVFALSSIVFSCSKPSSQSETSAPDGITNVAVAEVPTNSLGNSVWVNTRYLEMLEKTKSPLKAKIYADTVMVSFNAAADTANMVWNFHEGSAFKVKNVDKLELFNTYEIKPTPEYTGSVDGAILKLGTSNFKKVDAIEFIENKFWIGKYTSNGKTIELRPDNQLIGVDNFDTYQVWSDYVTTETNIDLVNFRKKDSDKVKTYGYKFDGKDIVFYDFIWQEDDVVGKAGKELFRWTRQ